MFVTNWISTTKIQKISEITNFFRHYFLSRTEVKYLTLWVAACIIAGIAIGKYLPAFPAALGKLEYANVSLPVAVLIWLMIYPMMLKIDFQSIKNVG